KDIIETNDVNRDFISDAYFKIAQSNNNQRNVVKGTINFTKISDNPDSSAISTLRTVNNVDSINKDMINEPGTYRISTEVEKNNITICNTLVVRVYDNDLLNELNNELGTSNTEKAIPNDYIELSNEPSIANQNINEFTNNKLTSEISNALSEEVYLSLEEKNDISAFIEMNVVPKKQRGIKSIAIRKAIRKLKGFISKKGEKWWKSKVLNKIKKLPFKNKYINKIEKWINFKNILKILARCDSIYSYIRNVVASTLYSWHWHWLIVEPISWAVEATVWYFF
ncbi:MAG: hypothetical protein LBT75_02365, partial [Bacilli bacterium]|nr:hypothetical protein [Bacilli bacterium]